MIDDDVARAKRIALAESNAAGARRIAFAGMTAARIVSVSTFLYSIVALAWPWMARADDAPPASVPAKYDTFVKGGTVTNGLLGVVRKDGRVYLVISKDQLGKDFIETSVPTTGIGGLGPAPEESDIAPARIIRFERVDDNVIVRWPNTYPKVDPNTPQAAGAALSFPNSVVAVAPIVAQSDTSVVISAAPFLGDLANLKAQFDQIVTKSEHQYHLDSARSFFTEAKSFPQNTIVRVSQTWSSDTPDTIDNAPDPRSVEVLMTYNIVAAPKDDGYMPRIADARVGYFEQPLIDFRSDSNPSRTIYYVNRWNFRPQTPGRPSPAQNPIVYTLSNDIPLEYRDAVRKSLLAWNEAFARVGIQNAISVRQQPDDPGFDADDIRNNMVLWVSSSYPSFGAEAQSIQDPRTGEELNVGIDIDAFAGLEGDYWYRYYVAPARGLPDSRAAEHQFSVDWIAATVLHESGHDMGLQHNFIASTAYAAKQLQSTAFTAKYGVASSVMEYAPMNVWPRGTPQGDFQQLVLGPYDYYAIKYGYGYIPNATTPEAELPALNAIASHWSDPLYRFASDEDVDFGSGHAVDPRVQQDDLTDHPVAWEQMQLGLLRSLMNVVDRRFPKNGESFDEARRAFIFPLKLYVEYAAMPAHVIGGEYISRANAGDPNSLPPFTPVSRADEYQAWKVLEDGLFSDAAWRFSPNVLNKLAYREVSSAGPQGKWVYDQPQRHDVAVVQIAGQTQESVLNELFAPLTLQRIDDLSTKYAPGTTMTLTDLFDWTRDGIFGDLRNGTIAQAGVVRRNVQMRLARRLAQLWLAPASGTPPDAQALARLQLEYLERDTAIALRAKLSDLPRAHVEALQALAHQALEARATLAPP